MNNNFNIRHDDYFKAVFSDIDLAKGLFKGLFSESIKNEIDLETLRLIPSDFRTKELSPYYADLMYEVSGLQGTQRIVMLFEHKSYKSKDVYLQFLNYQVQYWNNQKLNNDKEKIAVIIPILFYHGKYKWELKNLRALSDTTETFQGFFPNFDVIVCNLQGMRDTEIEALTDLEDLQAILKIFKHIWDSSFFDEKLVNLTEVVFNKRGNLLTQTLVYCIKYIKLNIQKVNDMINTIKDKRQQTETKTIMEQLLEKGKVAGKLEGKTEGIIESIEKMLLAKMTVKSVASILEIPIAEVQDILNRLQKDKSI